MSTTWDITGNAGTTPITNFLGTSDGQPLIIQPNGKVGIGGSLPEDKLQVFTISNSYGITHTDGNIVLSTLVDSDGGGVGTKSPHPLFFFVNNGVGSPAMTIAPSGNIGIGTPPTTTDKLRVLTPTGGSGITQTDGTIAVGTFVGGGIGGPHGSFGTKSNHPLFFFVNNSADPTMTITTSGNVGIGTWTPADKLQVEAPTSSYGITQTDGTITVGTFVGGAADGGGFGTKSNHPLSFFINGDVGGPAMTIATSGNAGIGTTAPQAKLDIAAGVTEGLRITNTNQHPYALMINNTTVGSTDATGFGLWQSDTGTAVLTNHGIPTISIDHIGNVGIGTTTPSTNLTVQGDVSVTGNITLTGDVVLTGADCAEEFDIAEAAEIEPGTVMVLDEEGALHQSRRAYDKRVAGVISGAGNYKPGLILDRRQSQGNRLPVALVGKVYCKVDARYASIAVGDLLTTSATPGHAMKADDPVQAFGSVIGKALRPLEAGQGMIPILIALQ